MDKQETIRFLKAACDLESAIEACNQELEDLNTKKELLGVEAQVPKPCFPKPPEKVKRISVDKEITFLVIALALAGLAVYIFIALQGYKHFLDKLVDFAIGILVSICALACLINSLIGFLDRKKSNQLYNEYIQKVKINKAECQKIIEDYQSVVNAVAENQKRKLKAIQELDGYIRRVQAKKYELEQLRSSFYDKGPLYKDYQNSLVAVTSIYSYMASGISDRLEGPDGALAQYQQDIRANKICTELREFKQAMLDGLQIIINNQNALRSLLEEIKDNLQRVELAVRDNTKQMQALAQINFQNQKSIAKSLEALNNEVWVNTQEVRMGNFISFLDYTDRKAATARSYV